MLREIARAGRQFELTWRYSFNLAPTLAYRFSKRSFSAECARVMTDLDRNGVAITSVPKLLGSDSCYEELKEAVAKAEHDRAEEIDSARAQCDRNDSVGSKSFIYALLGESPALQPQDVYARFALHRTILNIANAYIGMYTRLRYYNVWRTFASRAEPRQSQLWHRDREDRYICKVFVLLSDVDEGAGPFTYAPGTHAKGAFKCEPQCFEEADGVRRSDDAQMAAVVSPDRWIRGTGPAGTIVFADTRGYHKGGEARDRDRVMYTCMFTSPASESREFFRRPVQIPKSSNLQLAFALAPPKRGPWLSIRFK
jgi:hypothetical protein